MDYFDISNQQQPASGDILISNPMMGDPNFERSVIYLCEHNEQGSLGFVINQPAKVNLGDLVEDLESTETPIFIGGPVEQNTLHFIYKIGDSFPIGEELEGTLTIRDGIHMGGDFDRLKSLIKLYGIDSFQIKFFVGYSGWSQSQLESEIENNSWVVVKNPSEEEVFGSQTHTDWREIMVRLGGRYKMMANYPTDPRLN